MTFNRGNMKVLIIENDPEIVEAISLAIRTNWPDAKIMFAHQGRRGVELARVEAPDIILLDVKLCDTNGFEVLEAVRCFSSTPIVTLIGGVEGDQIVTSLQCGADGYIVMPLELSALLALIDYMVYSRECSGAEPSPFSD
jgi:two-component system KDP operon response regulator KdpE